MRFALVLTAALAWAGAARAEPVLWRIRDGNSSVVLLPSVHALPPDVQWRGPKVAEALEGAELVVFEFDQDPSPAQRQAIWDKLAELGRASDGRTLSSRLSAGGRERLDRHARALNIDPAFLEPLKPWYASMLLEQAADRRDGARMGLGVEQTIVAERGGRRLESFEGVRDVAGTIAATPEAEALGRLESLLSELDRPVRRTREHALERAWAQGRMEPVERMVEAQARSAPGLHRRLVVERNRRWAARIADLLNGSEDVLVVVGAAHFVGPDGLPALLRARGIVVEGP